MLPFKSFCAGCQAESGDGEGAEGLPAALRGADRHAADGQGVAPLRLDQRGGVLRLDRVSDVAERHKGSVLLS